MMAANLQIFMTNTASLTLQGNVEFMRNFGLEKLFISCRRRRAKTYVVPFDIKSHGGGGGGDHPDLNMSQFSRLATKKSV
jgi:hypothetical protein